MDISICTRFPEAEVEDIDKLVKSGRYMSRSDAIRGWARRGLREDQEKIERGKVDDQK